jgi:hypothetical protein
MNAKLIKRNYLRVFLGCCGAAALLLPVSGLMGNATAGAAARQAASQDASSQAAKPSLAGTWKLNKDQSDDPRQKMQQAMGNSGEGGGGGNPNRGEGRPGRGGPGGMMAEWSQLTVTQLDANVKITGSSGRTLATTTPPDDSAKSSDNSNGANDDANGGQRRGPQVLAQWQGNQLVVNGRGFGGGTTTRTYELSPDGKQLYVTTKMTSERLSQPVTYRLVYDKGSASGNSQ